MERNPVKVSDVLEQFKDFGFRLAAGEAGLENIIESVTVLELGATSQNPLWYCGHELVLSTLSSLETAEAVVELIELLSRKNAASLGVHRGHNGTYPTPEAIERADRLGFPIFSIPAHIPYSIIFTGVYEKIFRNQGIRVSNPEEARRMKLCEAVFEGGRGEEELEALASALSVNPREDNCVIAARLTGGRRQAGEGRFPEIEAAVKKQVALLNEKNIVLTEAEGFTIILIFKPGTGADENLKLVSALLETLTAEVARIARGARVEFGVSETRDTLLSLRQSRRHAGHAFTIGSGGNGNARFFDGAGIYALLDLDSMGEFHQKCLREIEPFRESCGRNADIYMDTVEAFVEAAESLPLTAEKLNLHINTVKYRINKIKEIAGKDFFTAGQGKMRIYLAIKAFKLSRLL